MESSVAISIPKDDKEVAEAANKFKEELADEADSFDEAAYQAGQNFEAEFKLSKVDTTIHRFPPGLGEIISSRYPSMVAPTFVSIGPYHHGKAHLEKMEALKKAAARFLGQQQSSGRLRDAVENAIAYYNLRERRHSDEEEKKLAALTLLEKLGGDTDTKDVVVAVEEAYSSYLANKTVPTGGGGGGGGGKTKTNANAHFAEMVLCDACFLLLYMDAYIRSYGGGGGYQVDESLRRFLFRHRHRINNDIMLLENQLPWGLLQVLMGLASGQDLKTAVGYFIASMGRSLKIRVSSELKPYEWDDGKDPTPHLLALLRRHIITQEAQAPAAGKTTKNSAEPGASTSAVAVDIPPGGVQNNSNNHPDLHQPLIPSTQAAPAAGNGNDHRQEVIVSAMSPMELREIGIKLRANKTGSISDMGLVQGRRLFFSHLTLAPLSLSDATSSWLVNMAAFEVCTASRFGDPAGATAVCSYLALLAFFMVQKEDVSKLRALRLLNAPDSDEDVLAFFATLKKHLPDYGRRFAEVMAGVEEQKTHSMTALYRWVYNNWKTVGAVVSIALAAASAIAGLIQLYRAILSLIHNN